MKVGDYVRTEDGTITRIKMFYEQKWEEPELIYAKFLCEDYEIYEYPRQVKSSPNIIDLIEVGDYVNGSKVWYIDDLKGCMRQFNYDYENPNDDCGHWEEEIQSVVTKEQFESMKYKVGD